MGKNILVAIDDSDNAMRAVRYIAENFNTNSRVTLFCVVPDSAALCRMNSPELTPYFLSQKSNFCLLEEKKKELMGTAMKNAKSILLEAGFDESKITLTLHIQKHGIARDIVDESGSGYDLLVMGRRGISGIKEFFMGSVSHNIFSLAKNISILIVN